VNQASVQFEKQQIKKLERRNAMTTIKREELKQKMTSGENIVVLNALGHDAYEKAHIPGSRPMDYTSISSVDASYEDTVIVYCTNESCPASYYAYHALRSSGYRNVQRYAGGLEDWQSAGYPLEGSLVKS
jgi:rhodanese-related sulfurtransferase